MTVEAATQSVLLREGQPRHLARFGLFKADLKSGELFKNGERVKLQEQPGRMLELLLHAPGEIVTREELKEKLWPAYDGNNHDAALNTCATRLRVALDDTGDAPQFVQTVARRGYRFIAPVSWEACSEPAAEAAQAQDKRDPSPAQVALARVAAGSIPTWMIVLAILVVGTALCLSLLGFLLVLHHVVLHHEVPGSSLSPLLSTVGRFFA